jgi:hypothetical protein
VSEFPKCPGFDLPHSLPRDAESRTDIRERSRKLGVESVPQYENEALSIVERGDRPFELGSTR